MFERYTESARRVIFFARYEASEFGSPYIETEHLLLGLLRQCKYMAARFSFNNLTYESVLKQVESMTAHSDKIPVSVDLPLSNEGKRVLAYGAEEAERFDSRPIEPEHLLLGLLREKRCFAAKMLSERGADLERIRRILQTPEPEGSVWAGRHPSRTRAKPRAIITIHDAGWDADHIRREAQKCREIAWHWEKKEWNRRDVVVNRKTGALSLDLALAEDEDTFELLAAGWKKDQCSICRWELYESDEAERGVGYTNGREWLCCECYERFVGRNDFFQSNYPEMT